VATPTNHSVVKAFALLRSFNEPDEWLTSAELSRRANLPGASGYRLVQTLEKVGAVVRGARGRYRPGLFIVPPAPKPGAGVVSEDILQSLAERIGAFVHMGVLDDGMVTYVAKHGSADLSIHTEVGAQQEAYCSGLGKILLSALSDEALDAYLCEGELIALTPQTITDPDAFHAEIRKVRAQDYAIDDREVSSGLACVAVPVRDGVGAVVAAISVSDSAERMTESRRHDVRTALLGASTAISRRLYS
jgi:IclR family acetate operon transcriptional repressor